MIFSQIIFWLSVFLIMHSYLFYPWILQLLSAKKKEVERFSDNDELFDLTVIMSVYNEAAILTRKLDSILNSNFPEKKLRILIGSDASSDDTNNILRKYSKQHSNLKSFEFENRQGKAAIINRLVQESQTDILIMTDAKVIFHTDTLRNLSMNFKNPDIGIVGGNILNEKVQKDGVSIQEKAFMSREILMKYREGLIWGSTVGVYGAIYAIRKDLYTPVPIGFAVDDFFISMNVLRKKKKAILDINTITYEEVPNLLSEEYRRKVRIATGNFRNFRYFFKELLQPWNGSSFAYISHKGIRWMGPFIILMFLISNILLYSINSFYNYSLYLTGTILFLPIIDYFLSKIGIHIVFLRFVRHFITMNVALLHGFINNIGGVKKDVWRPTNR